MTDAIPPEIAEMIDAGALFAINHSGGYFDYKVSTPTGRCETYEFGATVDGLKRRSFQMAQSIQYW